MQCRELVCILLLALQCWCAQSDFIDYAKARESIIQTEQLLTTGGRVHLNEKETKVNEVFMKYKSREIEVGFQNPNFSAIGSHFFKGKQFIDESNVFKILRRMPKGAVLHAHNTATVSSKWVVDNISYMPGLLRCTNKNEVSILSFRRSPKQHGCTSSYVSVSEERLRSYSIRAYDRKFEKLINLHTSIPEVKYPTITDVWNKFQNMFSTTNDMLRYLPAFRAYHYRMLEEMYDDNIMYGELRADFKELYGARGHIYNSERSAIELLNVVEQFRREHPKFMGIKIIFTTHRGADKSEIQYQYNRFLNFHAQHPEFVVGFDLVGQEDKGKPLDQFVGLLTDLPNTANFIFHAGETNWYGESTDYNLVDAILMNTTRIGHGYALMHHPILLNAVKNRNIAIEVCPISNQVLHLVSDMRNHPGSFYISENIPMIICNDDPGYWNAQGISYDYYFAIMSMAPSYAGLNTLKSLVWNSIIHSTLKGRERSSAFENLQREWDKFIDDTLVDFNIKN